MGMVKFEGKNMEKPKRMSRNLFTELKRTDSKV